MSVLFPISMEVVDGSVTVSDGVGGSGGDGGGDVVSGCRGGVGKVVSSCEV